jgi:two-component system LytT family response regulator
MQKVILIDDEAPARQLLREYLANHPELIIVGEANNGVDAVRLIKELRPELIFLDVQMPGLTGLEVLTHLDELPLIIFATAFDQYALKAFELHAVDYLLKPYTRERFEAAITHLNNRLHQPQQAVLQLTQAMVDEKDKNAYPGKILVAKGNKLVAVSVADIQYISAEGDYSSLITAEQRFLSQYGIGQIETKLNPQLFLRIHRSTILNINFVKEVFREGHTYDVRMQNGDVVKVSRSYVPKVKEIIF